MARHAASCLTIAAALASATVAAQTPPPTAPGPASAVDLPAVDIQSTRAATVAGNELPPLFPGGQVAAGGRVGMLGNQSVFDTPFSVTSFSSELMASQNATIVSDVLLNDPAVRLGANRFSDGQQRMIRGFLSNGQNTQFLGLPGIADYRRPRLEGIERVELFEGPSTLLNGAVGSEAVGGIINLVPKRAMDTPTRDFTFSGMSSSLFEGQADLGQRFGADNEWGVRANLSARGGSTPIDQQSESGGVGTIALDYRGRKLRVSLDASHQSTYIAGESPTFTVAPGIAVPKAPDATINILGDGTTYSSVSTFGVLHAEYDITDHISVFGSYGLATIHEIYNGGYAPTITDTLGNATVPSIPYVAVTGTETSNFGARATFDTWSVAHRFSLAADRYDQVDSYNYAFAHSFESNIYSPVQQPVFANPDFDWHPDKTVESKRNSYAVADTMSVLDERIMLTAGGRLQYMDERNFDTDGATTSRYQTSRISPAVALVVKPIPMLSLYGNYIEQLNPGQQAPIGTLNAGAIFPPYVATQKEVGAKYDFGRIAVTGALFEIIQPNGATDTATNTFGVNGEQRNRGIELKTFGEARPGLRLLGGVAFIQGTQTKTVDGVNDGKTAVAVPVTNISFGAEWDMPYLHGLTLTGRTIYTAGAYINEANTQKIPDYARFDIGARYAIDRGPSRAPILVRGGIENVGGANYWQASTYGISVGQPRTFYLATSFSL